MCAVWFKIEHRKRAVLYGTVSDIVSLLLANGLSPLTGKRATISERRFWSKMCHVQKPYNSMSFFMSALLASRRFMMPGNCAFKSNCSPSDCIR